MLLQSGNAPAAEKIFREDLELNPRNPRSLFGLVETLVCQNRLYEASWVSREFDEAWNGADIELKVEDL